VHLHPVHYNDFYGSIEDRRVRVRG
jgi:hypothetical protein